MIEKVKAYCQKVWLFEENNILVAQCTAAFVLSLEGSA
jgi:hypothetical protein